VSWEAPREQELGPEPRSEAKKSATCECLAQELSTLIAPDIVEYLDTGKIGVRSVAGERIIFARPGARARILGGRGLARRQRPLACASVLYA
jgi:hypothetical protein